MIARARIHSVAMSLVAIVALLLTSFPPSLLAQEKDATPPAKPVDATGTWQWSLPGPRGEVRIVLKLKQDGETLTGTMTSPVNDEETQIKEGSAKDGQITFKVERPFGNQRAVTTYTARITAEVTIKGKSETVMTREFEGKKEQ